MAIAENAWYIIPRAEQLSLMSELTSQSADVAMKARVVQAERALAEARAKLKAQELELTQERVNALRMQRELRLLQAQVKSGLGGNQGGGSALLRELRKVAHPDKWSQGQLASDLAHELSVVLNSKKFGGK